MYFTISQSAFTLSSWASLSCSCCLCLMISSFILSNVFEFINQFKNKNTHLGFLHTMGGVRWALNDTQGKPVRPYRARTNTTLEVAGGYAFSSLITISFASSTPWAKKAPTLFSWCNSLIHSSCSGETVEPLSHHFFHRCFLSSMKSSDQRFSMIQ